jgi:hypothetical protein
MVLPSFEEESMSTSGVVITLVLAGLIVLALVIIWRKAGTGEQGSTRVYYLLSMICLSYGMFALLAPALGALGGFSSLPASFEWPVGTASGVVRDTAGRYFVPLESASRVQVYDEGKRFLHGWAVEANGGTFKLQIAGDDFVDVFTANGQRHFVFRSDGTLVKDHGSYSTKYSDVAPEPKSTERFDTFFFLLPFADPRTAWTVCIVGAFGLFALNRVKRKSAAGTGQEQPDGAAKPPPDSAP